MKHLLHILLVATALFATATAQPLVLVLEKAGDIKSKELLVGKEETKELIVKGKMNYLDLKEIGRRLQSLERLTLKEASFEKYVGEGYDDYFQANCFPTGVNGHPTLRYLELPESIVQMTYYSLHSCKAMDSLSLHAVAPPSIDYHSLAGDDLFERCILFVPAESVETYKTKGEGWKFSKVEALKEQEESQSDAPNFVFYTDKLKQNFSVGTTPSGKVKAIFPDKTVLEETADGEYGVARFAHVIKGEDVEDVSNMKVVIVCDGLVSFTAQDTGIKAIALMDCPKLTRLGLHYQKLQSLDLAPAKESLKELYLLGNASLKELTFQDFTALQWLNVSNIPELSELNITGCTALEHLFAFNTKLSNLDLSPYKLLQELDLTNTGTAKLSIKELTALKRLLLADNKLTTLDVSTLTQLTELNVADNQLEGLDLKAANLETLNIANNQFDRIDLSASTKLTSFACEFNKFALSTLPSWLPEDKGEYTYAPQEVWAASSESSISTDVWLDFSSEDQLRGVLAAPVPSVFVWYDAKTDDVLVAGVDYEQAADKPANFRFIKARSDSVYAIIQTQAFPQFAGKKAFRTKNIFITKGSSAEVIPESRTLLAYRQAGVVELRAGREGAFRLFSLSGECLVQGVLSQGETRKIIVPQEPLIVLFYTDRDTTTLKL